MDIFKPGSAELDNNTQNALIKRSKTRENFLRFLLFVYSFSLLILLAARFYQAIEQYGEGAKGLSLTVLIVMLSIMTAYGILLTAAFVGLFLRKKYGTILSYISFVIISPITFGSYGNIVNAFLEFGYLTFWIMPSALFIAIAPPIATFIVWSSWGHQSFRMPKLPKA